MSRKVGGARRYKISHVNNGVPMRSSAIGKVMTAVGMGADGRAISNLGDERTVSRASQHSNYVEEVILDHAKSQLWDGLHSDGHRRTG